MSIIERIGEFINDQDISIRSFEKSISASDGMIRRALSNNTEIQSKWLTLIAENYPHANIEWLITGKGEMLKNDKLNDKSNDKQEIINIENNPYNISKDKEDINTTKKKFTDISRLNEINEKEMSLHELHKNNYNIQKQLIPLYDIEATAGFSAIFSRNNNHIPIDYISVPNAPKCDGSLCVRGDSMYPIIKAGDIVCYKEIQDYNNIRFGEVYLLYIDDGDDEYITLKYVQKSDRGDDYLKLVSQNANHNDKDEHISHIKALAIVKMWIRFNTIT